jgi:hypothetical protein
MAGAAPITKFRRFLKEAPQPAALRIDENEKKVIRVHHKQRGCWSEAEKSVLAFDATLVEALDGQGNVLRVFRLKEDDAEAPKPREVETWPDAPEAQMAQIIVASNDRTGARLEAVFRMSFDRMSAMFDSMMQRHDEAVQRAAQADARLERERRAWLERELRAAGAPATEDDEPSFNGLLGTLIAAQIERHMAGANGAAHPNGKDA